MFLAAIGLVVFLPAGTLDWPRAWALLAVYTLAVGGFVAVLRWRNPEALAARMRGAGEGTKPFDRVFVPVWTVLILAMLLVSGLDAVRFGWAPLPDWTLVPGFGLMGLAMVPIGWSAAHNPHLEGTVRIQHDRGHRVVSTGPYAWVRHPMYVGSLLWLWALPLILGSTWAMVPAALASAAMVWRTALEDATLREELPGYADFADQTRYRLLPGIW